jgi:hypothetical protein
MVFQDRTHLFDNAEVPFGPSGAVGTRSPKESVRSRLDAIELALQGTMPLDELRTQVLSLAYAVRELTKEENGK